MSEWVKKLVGKNKVKCFYCQEKISKKIAFNVKLNTAEGLLTLKSCEKCAKDVNDVLKEIEEVKDFGNI